MGYDLTPFQHAYIIERFYGNTSLRRISFDFRNNFGLPISAATVLRRVVENTITASEVMEYLMKTECIGSTQKKSDFIPVLGDIWEVDETSLPIGKERVPLIAVKDLKTCYFPAANLEKASTIETTARALICARDLARKCPVELRGDGNPAYEKAVRLAFGRKTKLTINKKIGPMGQDQSIEGTFGASIKSWIKSKRSLHSWLISPIIVKGYILDYHFARPCEALCGQTPAEAAMAWNPLDGKRGWPALLQLAEYYGKTIVTSKKQNKISKRIQRQITLDELPLIDNNWTRKDDPSTGNRNKQLRLGSFLT